MAEIKGHANEWVALVDNEVIIAEKSFINLVKKLTEKKLLEKAVVTHVSGSYAVFYANLSIYK